MKSQQFTRTQKIRQGIAALLAACAAVGSSVVLAAAANDKPWTFAVSGDSRNCGDVVMPAIAASARQDQAEFYWHLGDLRALYDFDEDFRQLHPRATISDYFSLAWQDFIVEQIKPFGEMPFYVGIGNHELVEPKSRQAFIVQFADWLDSAAIREQRLRDDADDHEVRTYYHWQRDGIDFINLDNATDSQFDDAQVSWALKLIDRDRADPSIRAIVVGMHEALPESIARHHSMSDTGNGEATGLKIYQQLLKAHEKKAVYVLASHTHLYMGDIFNDAYWHANGGVLKGYIVGTAGAVRYKLPEDLQGNTDHKVNTYGYLLATVNPSKHTAGERDDDPIRFTFKEVTPAQLPATTAQKFGQDFVNWCYTANIKK